ncbi:MAG: hypothetical protein AAFW98_04105 [Pseudomonadota bacterium]
MDRLDKHERKRIVDAAGREPREGTDWQLLEPQSSPIDHGDERLRRALGMVAAISRWAEEAAREADAEVVKNRTFHGAERAAINALADLWRDLSGAEPGTANPTKEGQPRKRYSPFIDLCRGVLQPVPQTLGVKAPLLGETVQEVLSPGEASPKKGARKRNL